ncbi:uncharacterized protein LOC132603274 [Lycium barbarum]|uniref:uncharacterized protein LOC132603274 n=1 Tax=Lycium barbarum TaxID=112863 RepID=UPI00293E870B|nr:uncharacterized protein LOC132603274 [Lycium barbarum]
MAISQSWADEYIYYMLVLVKALKVLLDFTSFWPNMWLPTVVSQYIPPRVTTTEIVHLTEVWTAKVVPCGERRRIMDGWKEFVYKAGFEEGDVLDFVMFRSSDEFVKFVVVNDDPIFIVFSNALPVFLV